MEIFPSKGNVTFWFVSAGGHQIATRIAYNKG